MSRAILITGATGKQGGSVLNALVASQPSDFLLLAVTRDAQSPRAKALCAKSSSIRLVEGNLDSIPTLFEAARKAAGSVPLWGVYSMQASIDSRAPLAGELKQGKEMIDEAIKAGIQHFIYSSVDRGGNDKSWNNPTCVPHFKTKHDIEIHLRDSTANGKCCMSWTILRPVNFIDSIAPGFQSKVFMTAVRNTLKEKPLQWVVTKDIGVFAAKAFHDPTAWANKAVGIAGDELTFSQLSQTFERVTGSRAGTTFGFLGKALMAGVAELGSMINWLRDEGYKVDIEEVKKVHPDITSVETWLKTSAFAQRSS
ncbi:hypothetical protein BGZ61DRAFT_362591 [Ilyonectria robusta]|uniref:uncharacterized protein n=1 Tax=Ilyonectria robusta TaxID=1079257 RepID=UPI001E8DE911|nr:uncharacterized protein BGZ61DRAFT_362591 [Ilyonectria robusta]KAH8672242.1 hypothetical protein BGZ61DRAFT_362591 [Ilyonectria robusta]